MSSQKGITLMFTGLPCSGKTTIANALKDKLTILDKRPVIVLDSDQTRSFLSSELGFTKEDRRKKLLRIAYVASLLLEMGGIVICSVIAPYEEHRSEVKNILNKKADYCEIYVSTPLEICKLRDNKGLYKKAEKGLIDIMTGITQPYMPPKHPDLTIDTSQRTINSSVDIIIKYLLTHGYIDVESSHKTDSDKTY